MYYFEGYRAYSEMRVIALHFAMFEGKTCDSERCASCAVFAKGNLDTIGLREQVQTDRQTDKQEREALSGASSGCRFWASWSENLKRGA